MLTNNYLNNEKMIVTMLTNNYEKMKVPLTRVE